MVIKLAEGLSVVIDMFECSSRRSDSRFCIFPVDIDCRLMVIIVEYIQQRREYFVIRGSKVDK